MYNYNMAFFVATRCYYDTFIDTLVCCIYMYELYD